MCLIFYASCTILICTIKIIYWFNFCTNQRESNWGYFWSRCIFVFCLASLSLYKESSWPLLWMWSVYGAFLRRSRITLRAIQTLDPDSDSYFCWGLAAQHSRNHNVQNNQQTGRLASFFSKFNVISFLLNPRCIFIFVSVKWNWSYHWWINCKTHCCTMISVFYSYNYCVYSKLFLKS